MRQRWHRTPHAPVAKPLAPRLVAASLLLAGSALSAFAAPRPLSSPIPFPIPLPVPRKDSKPKIAAVRWDETYPGCTFFRGDDGRYRYGLTFEDLQITVGVDSQEVEKVHRRHEPFFAVLVDVRYRGAGSLDVGEGPITLEFVKHFKVQQPALDPDSFAEKVQNDADELDHAIARDVEKHPEQKAQKEALLKAFLKDSAELQEFIGKNSLRPTRLGSGNQETSGWVLFGTDSKWIGRWKKQEEFILRLPLAGKVFEFPFKLPPKPGEVLLRKRD